MLIQEQTSTAAIDNHWVDELLQLDAGHLRGIEIGESYQTVFNREPGTPKYDAILSTPIGLHYNMEIPVQGASRKASIEYIFTPTGTLNQIRADFVFDTLEFGQSITSHLNQTLTSKYGMNETFDIAGQPFLHWETSNTYSREIHITLTTEKAYGKTYVFLSIFNFDF